MIISRLYALLFLLLLLPAPIQAEITVMSDLDGGERIGEPQRAVAVSSLQSGRSQTMNTTETAAYILNAGDSIAIRVFGEDSLNLDVVLDNSGVINYPFLGKVFVNGLSVESLTQVITEGLSDGYLKNPHVNVSIIKYRPFFITGQVNNPGSFPYEPGLTVKKAVSLAGGFTDMADRNQITIVFEKSTGQSAKKIGINGSIHSGDTISIGGRGYFFIDGEVKSPGRYPLQVGLTLRKAISMAGGYTEHAAKGNVLIMSNHTSGERKGHMNDFIKAGDSITVDESLF